MNRRKDAPKRKARRVTLPKRMPFVDWAHMVRTWPSHHEEIERKRTNQLALKILYTRLVRRYA